ncbi:FAD-dependent oxidoreductase, partial [Thermodesulfobacteriota bacterium]
VEQADIQLDGGIVVNDRMETSCRGIYAAGDVAITKDSITGQWFNNAIWPAATRSIAGNNMVGEARQYRHNFPINALELFGMRVMSAGHPMASEGDVETIEENSQKGEYIKRVIRQDRLGGFIMIGNISQAGTDLQIMKKNVPVGTDVQQKETLTNNRLPKGFGYAHGRIFR